MIGKKDWPDDLEVSMNYIDARGKSQKLILVNGSTLVLMVSQKTTVS